MIDYQLCDGNGYVVDSGQIFIDKALGTGDKFTDDSLTIYDLIPGETYVLTFQDGAWQMKKKDKSSQPVCWQNDTVENK